MANPARSTTNGRAKARERSVAVARQGVNTSTKAGAALVDADKPLTDQQRLFVKFWAQGESPLSASVKAGYSDGGTFAYRMIYMPNILKAYQAEKDAYERDSGMNRKRVIDGFLEAVEMAKTMAEPSTMVAGWREIGKMCGYYEPVQVKHTVTHEGKVLLDRLENLSDDELFELIQKQAAQMAATNPQPQLQGATHDDGDDDEAGGLPP